MPPQVCSGFATSASVEPQETNARKTKEQAQEGKRKGDATRPSHAKSRKKPRETGAEEGTRYGDN
jgi:hypothetical protein